MKKVQIISILFICAIVILVLTYNRHNQQNNKITETNKSNDIKIKRLASNVNDDWALEALGWTKAIGERSNTNIKVAIIDSGIDKNIKDVNIKQKKVLLTQKMNLDHMSMEPNCIKYYEKWRLILLLFQLQYIQIK